MFNTFAPSVVEKINRDYVGKVSYGDDSNTIAVFENYAFENEAKTRVNGGIPVYEDKLMLRLYFVGDKTKSIFQEAKEPDKKRFKDAWEKFQAGLDQVPDGTPLKLMPWITPAMIKNLAVHHIHTVEQLKGMNDAACQSIGMGALELRKKAVIYSDARESSEPLLRTQAENEQLRAEVEKVKKDLTGQVDELKALLKAAAKATEEKPKTKTVSKKPKLKEQEGEPPFPSASE
jgi:hypothetical protein